MHEELLEDGSELFGVAKSHFSQAGSKECRDEIPKQSMNDKLGRVVISEVAVKS